MVCLLLILTTAIFWSEMNNKISHMKGLQRTTPDRLGAQSLWWWFAADDVIMGLLVFGIIGKYHVLDTFSFIVPPQTLARGHCIPLWLKCASNLLYWSFFHAVLLIAESDHSDWYWRYCMYSGSTYAWTNCFLLLGSCAGQPIILLVSWNSRKKYHNLYAAGHTPISFLWLPFTITSICLLQVFVYCIDQ